MLLSTKHIFLHRSANTRMLLESVRKHNSFTLLTVRPLHALT